MEPAFVHPFNPSWKRARLCSREHAHRVAERMFEAAGENMAVVRALDPL